MLCFAVGTMPGQDQSSYAQWSVPDKGSFLFKAKRNLIFAEKAREREWANIEANRIYYALHQLACELVRCERMVVKRQGRRATAAEPWRIDHGSYYDEIRKVLDIQHADRVYAAWNSFRNRADYDSQDLAESAQWKEGSPRRRKQALDVAEAIYEKLSGTT